MAWLSNRPRLWNVFGHKHARCSCVCAANMWSCDSNTRPHTHTHTVCDSNTPVNEAIQCLHGCFYSFSCDVTSVLVRYERFGMIIIMTSFVTWFTCTTSSTSDSVCITQFWWSVFISFLVQTESLWGKCCCLSVAALHQTNNNSSRRVCEYYHSTAWFKTGSLWNRKCLIKSEVSRAAFPHEESPHHPSERMQV